MGRLTRRRAARLVSLVEDLSGRSHRHLVEPLVAQVDAAVEGARLTRDMVLQELTPSEARAKMNVVEHVGDQHRAHVVEALARMLTTPIDREDVFRLSRAIDDVLDNLRDFVRESDLYHLADQGDFLPLIDAVAAGIEALRPAVACIGVDPRLIPERAFAARKSANLVRREYQQRLAELFDEEFGKDMLKRRELLRRIDVVGTQLGEAADMLADGALKRSH